MSLFISRSDVRIRKQRAGRPLPVAARHHLQAALELRDGIFRASDLGVRPAETEHHVGAIRSEAQKTLQVRNGRIHQPLLEEEARFETVSTTCPEVTSTIDSALKWAMDDVIIIRSGNQMAASRIALTSGGSVADTIREGATMVATKRPSADFSTATVVVPEGFWNTCDCAQTPPVDNTTAKAMRRFTDPLGLCSSTRFANDVPLYQYGLSRASGVARLVALGKYAIWS